MTEQGMAKYSARAFKQDSAAAMKGEIDRGLIELITNADDAYGEGMGEILIRIKRGAKDFPLEVSVSDSAKGLTYSELKTAFTEIGAMTSGLANGGMTRGMLGRGAKDVASFGAVKFEAIKNGKYSELTLFQDSSYISEYSDVEATAGHYKSLNLERSQNGLTATVLCAKEDHVKSNAELVKKLGSVSQLRDLISRRKVFLQDDRKGGSQQVIENWLPKGEDYLTTEIELEGYEGKATLKLRKLHEVQSTPVSDWSANGVLIKSGISIFQNTWFTSSLSKRTASRILAGEVVVPQISEVLKSELAAQRDNNEFSEVQLLSRTRDGLEKNHPLWKSLVKAVEIAVHEIFDDFDDKANSGQRQGDKLSRDFDIAAAALTPDITEILKDLDDELPENGNASGMNKLDVIPKAIVVGSSAKFSLSIRVDNALTSSPLVVNESGARSGIELIAQVFGQSFSPNWLPHDRLEGKSVASVKFEAPAQKGVYFIDIKIGTELSSVQVVVADKNPIRKPAPEGLEFAQQTVYSSPGRGKNLLLRAPLSMSDLPVSLSLQGVPATLTTPIVTLHPEEEGGWVEAFVHVKTSLSTGDIDIEAHTGEEQTKAVIKVEEAKSSNGKNSRLSFELNGDRDPIVRFSVIESGVGAYKVIVYGRHKIYNDVFGEYVGTSEGFTNEDSPTARAVLSQVISQAFAQQLVELAFDKKPEGKWDAASTMYRFNEYSEKIVGTLHKALVK